MDQEEWLQSWQDGRIGFNQSQANAMLQRHWDKLQLAPGSRVLVPLAGKSIDMTWLAGQGHQIRGVELSPLAIDQFFAERGLDPAVSQSPSGQHYRAGPYEIICGDIFQLDPSMLQDCAAIYDRAAMVALPAAQRRRYAQAIYAHMPSRSRGLLLTLEYEQQNMQGPPFSVAESELPELLSPGWEWQLLEREDELLRQPHFRQRGLKALEAAAYILSHHG